MAFIGAVWIILLMILIGYGGPVGCFAYWALLGTLAVFGILIAIIVFWEFIMAMVGVLFLLSIGAAVGYILKQKKRS